MDGLDLGMIRYPLAFLGALVLSLYLTPIIRKGAIRYGVVDHPDGRLKTHEAPVAYLGGVAIYLAFLCALAFAYDFERSVLAILLAASIVVMLGLFDDLKVLSPGLKLIGQGVAALVLVKAGVTIQLTFLPPPLATGLTVLWLIGITNAINLIDVSDGLAAGVTSVAGVFLFVIALLSGDETIAMLTLCLVGSTLGFLAHNRPPASIYLGDTGSMFLGFMLGALTMRGQYTGEHRLGALAPVILLGVPIFDTLFVIGARAARGLPIMEGSPDHFAVRLRRHRVSAGRIAAGACGVSVVLGGLSLALVLCPIEVGLGVLIAAAIGGLGAVVGFVRLGGGPEEEATKLPSVPSAPHPPEGSR